jgi:hypothetical protein
VTGRQREVPFRGERQEWLAALDNFRNWLIREAA